MNQMNH